MNPDKYTSKLREVFDASDENPNGNDLNGILHVGHTIQVDRHIDFAMAFIPFRFMYSQIGVSFKHTKFHRILFP